MRKKVWDEETRQREFQQMDRIFSHRQAARYVGLHPQGLEKRVQRGYVEPLRMENGDRVYTESMLVEMEVRMSVQILECTIEMVAAYYGRHRNSVSIAFESAGLKPLRTVGHLGIYDAKEANRVATERGWRRELDERILRIAKSARPLREIGTFKDGSDIEFVRP